jgi:hypothetical protein
MQHEFPLRVVKLSELPLTPAESVAIRGLPEGDSARRAVLEWFVQKSGHQAGAVLLNFLAGPDRPNPVLAERAAAFYVALGLPSEPLDALLLSESLDPSQQVALFTALREIEAPPDRSVLADWPPRRASPRLGYGRRVLTCRLATRWLSGATRQGVREARLLAALIGTLESEAADGSPAAAQFLRDPHVAAARRHLALEGFLTSSRK